MRFLCSLLACLLLMQPASAKGRRYIRIVASDDTCLMQAQKYWVRDTVLRCLERDMTLSDTEALLCSIGVPARCVWRQWSPPGLHPQGDTLYVTLGAGNGRNWWGVLCDEEQIHSLFSTQKKSGASFYAARLDRDVVFPLFSKVLNLFTFRSPPAASADCSDGSEAVSAHPAWNWLPSVSAFQNSRYRCTGR